MDTQILADHAERHAPGTYCDRCGARINGKGAWGHDSDCPVRKEHASSQATHTLIR